MKRKSLKGQLSCRLQQCCDSLQLTDTELLISAVNSLINSTEQLHHKLSGAELAKRVEQLEQTLRFAHAELTDHGHQELPECECRIAYVLRATAETKAQPLLEESGPDDPEPRY